MDNVTYTISGVDQDKGCVRVEMATPEGHELHEDVYADLTDQEAVVAAIEAVARKFAADVVGKTPTSQAKAALPIEALIGQTHAVGPETG